MTTVEQALTFLIKQFMRTTCQSMCMDKTIDGVKYQVIFKRIDE